MKTIVVIQFVMLTSHVLLAQDSVRIMYIANEGVFIHAGEDQAMIDALHKPYQPDYLATPDYLLEQIFENRRPFTSVDVFLVSHIHRDHMDAKLSADYLKSQAGVTLFTNDQILDSIAFYLDISDRLSMNFKRLAFDQEGGNELQKEGMKVRVYPIMHGHTKWRWIENLGHVIEIRQLKILHVGDPSYGETGIQRLMEKEGTIDIAILPHWFMTSKEGRGLIDGTIKPDHLIAVHIPPREADEIVRQIQNFYPEAVVFTDPMEELTFAASKDQK